jgi:hypothetical protein
MDYNDVVGRGIQQGTPLREQTLMSESWWFVLTVAAVLGALAIMAWPHWRRYRVTSRFEQARKRFHLRREWLEVDFLKGASAASKDRGLDWQDCEFEDEAFFATDRKTGQLRAFVGLTIFFSRLEDALRERPAGTNVRAATAVFCFDGRDWDTDGRALFNLNPFEAIERFKHELEQVD